MLRRAAPFVLVALSIACGSTAGSGATCSDCQPNDGSAARVDAAHAHCSDPSEPLEITSTPADLTKLLAGRWVSCSAPTTASVFSGLGVEFAGDGTWAPLGYNMIGDVIVDGFKGTWSVSSELGKLIVQITPHTTGSPAPATAVEIVFEAHASRMRTLEIGTGSARTFAPMMPP